MNRSILRFLNSAIVVALIFGSGAQLLVLQSVAWTNMLITYSQTVPIAEALQKTFDGKHPCKLCKHIQGVEKETQQSEGLSPSSQLLFTFNASLIPASVTLTPPTGELFDYARVASAYSRRSTPPLSPPPRV